MRGVWLLIFALIATVGNGLFFATDLAWRLEGSKPENYPEVFYALYFFPTSVLLLLDAILLLWARPKEHERALWLAAEVKLIGLGLLSLIFAVPFNPKWPFMQSAGQFVIDYYIFIAYPLYLFLTGRWVKSVMRVNSKI